MKALKEEIQRKKDVIIQLKTSKEQTESEAKEAVAGLEWLKDDNAKLQKLIKDNAKQIGMVRELKSANEQLRATERRLREEMVQVNERMRAAKAEVQRKETMARDLKDKLDGMQEENQDSRDRSSDMERLRDQIKKLKLETEIKDNQVRTLKAKLEHFESECD